jgi:hypothetical protein
MIDRPHRHIETGTAGAGGHCQGDGNGKNERCLPYWPQPRCVHHHDNCSFCCRRRQVVEPAARFFAALTELSSRLGQCAQHSPKNLPEPRRLTRDGDRTFLPRNTGATGTATGAEMYASVPIAEQNTRHFRPKPSGAGISMKWAHGSPARRCISGARWATNDRCTASEA